MLKLTGKKVRLKICRYTRGLKFEQQQVEIFLQLVFIAESKVRVDVLSGHGRVPADGCAGQTRGDDPGHGRPVQHVPLQRGGVPHHCHAHPAGLPGGV